MACFPEMKCNAADCADDIEARAMKALPLMHTRRILKSMLGLCSQNYGIPKMKS